MGSEMCIRDSAGVLLRAGACPGAVVGLVARLVRLLVARALAAHTAARL